MPSSPDGYRITGPSVDIGVSAFGLRWINQWSLRDFDVNVRT
ncbi:MAG TPA: hypothetical protein VKI41_04665 [Vicinamibacteria bacterium]|nr:hypothetical protein [Vicinamibacteria bacterium]